MKKKYLAFAALATLLASCSNEEDFTPQVNSLKDTPITVSAMVGELATRAGYDSENLPEKFYMKIDQAGEDYDYNVLMKYESNEWVAYDTDEIQKITLLWEGSDGVTVTAATFSVSETPADLTVETGQNSDENLDLSDHLFYTSSTVNPSTEGISIVFDHIMAKIDLTITLGTEFAKTDNPITDVTFGGTKTACTYDYSAEESSKWSFADDATATGITALEGTYTAPTTEVPNATAQYEVILVPRTIAAGTFTVTFNVGERVFSWTSAEAVTLASGYKYTLNLTAGKDKVDGASFTAAAWNTENNLIGETE